MAAAYRARLFIVERRLVLEERVVHLPEASLGGSRLRRFGRVRGVWMGARER